MPALRGILETALYVEDLPRSAAFYCDLFQIESVFSDEHVNALAVREAQVLLLFKKGSSLAGSDTPEGWIPGHDGCAPAHIAFAIDANELEPWSRRLEEKRILIESRITWPAGGTSLFFRDPDRHLLELATPGLWKNYS